MEITIFDLLEVIKDTNKPILVTLHNSYEAYTYRDLALNDSLLTYKVSSLTIDMVDGQLSYVLKVRR